MAKNESLFQRAMWDLPSNLKQGHSGFLVSSIPGKVQYSLGESMLTGYRKKDKNEGQKGMNRTGKERGGKHRNKRGKERNRRKRKKSGFAFLFLLAQAGEGCG